ncbi:MAG TPA: 4-hydroxy-tetrahydrodipicolinate reductase [Bacillota bacterium]|nr:4-hydroxy-tetrahydrodipicolinate reductase [Bacillota bacterium]
MEKIRVLVTGIAGRMGQEVARAVIGDPELTLVAGIDVCRIGEDLGRLVGREPLGIAVESDLTRAIQDHQPHVMVEFTSPETAAGNILTALSLGVRPVVGTTGLSEETLKEISEICDVKGLGCLIASNFALGAILMMKFAASAAEYFPDVEIIELHHDQKMDAPSGIALSTARAIAALREKHSQGHPQEVEKLQGARGADYEGIRVHSVRLPGYLAHQEVIFGGLGQTLTIRHDTISRESFMPGVLLGIKRIANYRKLIIGLENIL